MIRIENFEIDNTVKNISEKIELPSDIEMEIASFVDENGGHLIKAWFEPSRKMFSPNQDQIRNRASTDRLDAIHIEGYTPIKNFINFAGDSGLETRFLSYGGLQWTHIEHTFFIVAQVSSTMAGGNTSLLGRMKNDTSVNVPNLNITKEGVIRFFMTEGVGNLGLSYKAPDGATKKPFLVTISHSTSNGITLRFNGVEVANSKTDNAKRPGGVSVLKFLGDEIVSTAFQGIVGTALLCNKDLTGTDELLTIEQYLLEKYEVKE